MQLRFHKDPCHGAELEIHIPPDRPVVPAVFYTNSAFILRITNTGNINPPGTLRIPAPHGHIPADIQPAGRLDPPYLVKIRINMPFTIIFAIKSNIDIASYNDIFRT